MESFSFRTAIHESNQIRGDASWVQFIRRAKAPELPVVLLEDFAALIGLVFALFGVGLTLITGNGVWDGVGTALIGLLLVASRSCWRSRPRACCSARAPAPRRSAGIRGGARAADGVERRHPHADDAPRARGAAGRGQDRRRRAATARPRSARARSTPPRRAIREAEPIARVIYLEPDISPEESVTGRRASERALTRSPERGSSRTARLRLAHAIVATTVAHRRGRPACSALPDQRSRPAHRTLLHGLQGRRPLPGRVRPQRDPARRARDARPDGDARGVRRPTSRWPAPGSPARCT